MLLLVFAMYARTQVLRTAQNRFVLNIVRRFRSTQLNYENEVAPEKQLYPLEGIRILDLTRIGDFLHFAFCISHNLQRHFEFSFFVINQLFSGGSVLYDDSVGFGCGCYKN